MQLPILLAAGHLPSRAAGEDDPKIMSASQLNVWHECQRKWAWKYVAKLRPEQHKSAALGVKVHSQLERYLKTGEMPDFVADPDAGNIAASGLHHLPPPGSEGLEIEQHFKFRSAKTGIFYRGFIDVLWPPAGDRDPTIFDHKTTSDLKWAKTPEELLTDTQAVIYAQAAFERWPEAPKVNLQWTYFQTRKTRKSLPVFQTLSREHVSHTFPLIELGAQAIVTTLLSKKQPLELPPNPRACGAFGGCPFTAQCNLSPEETIRAMNSADAKTESFLSRIGTPEPATTAAPAPNFLASLMGAPSSPPAMPVSDTDVPAPTDLSQTAFGAPKLPVSDQPINPPEHQAPPVSPLAEAATPETPPTTEKPKRGRPKGSKNTPKTDENERPTIPAPPPETESATPTAIDEIVQEPEKLGLYDTAPKEPFMPRVLEAPAPKQDFTLYVDCFPVGRRAKMVEVLIAKAQDTIRETTGKADYRMVDYGQGAGLLSGLVASYAGDEDIVLDSRTPEGAACKAALMAKASLIVLGAGR